MNNTTFEQAMLRRTERLVGTNGINEIQSKRVIIFGVGGVGSWCAESLIRSGIRHLTIVDSDRVCITNCNRQLMATSSTIGQVKVEVLRNRLLDINPAAEVVALQRYYNAENAESFHIEQYDYVIDAIDSLKDKAHLILHATSIAKQIKKGILKGEGITKQLTFFSSMGAALRIDPTQIRVAEFWNVKNDPLGKALRKRFRSRNESPAVKFKCVYSEELPMKNKGEVLTCGLPQCICNSTSNSIGAAEEQNNNNIQSNNLQLSTSYGTKSSRQINGSLSHITSIFGFTIAGLVMQDILK